MVQKDLNRNEWKMPLELFGFLGGGDMEAASSLSLITLPFLSAILRLEGLDLLNLPLSRN